MKAINYAPTPRSVEIQLNGIHVSGAAKVTTLASADLNAENSFDHPTAVTPESSTLEVRTGANAVLLRPYSVTVYRIPAQ